MQTSILSSKSPKLNRNQWLFVFHAFPSLNIGHVPMLQVQIVWLRYLSIAHRFTGNVILTPKKRLSDMCNSSMQKRFWLRILLFFLHCLWHNLIWKSRVTSGSSSFHRNVSFLTLIGLYFEQEDGVLLKKNIEWIFKRQEIFISVRRSIGKCRFYTWFFFENSL